MEKFSAIRRLARLNGVDELTSAEAVPAMLPTTLVARICGCSKDTVRRWVLRGQVTAFRMGWFLIERDSLEVHLARTFVDAQKDQAA